MAAVRTLSADVLPEAVAVLLMANAYTVGFIIVILGRTDLFTEYTTIAILSVLMGRASVAALGRLWGLIYLANLVGAAAFAALTAVLGPSLNVIDPRVLGDIAQNVVVHPWWVVLLSAGLAGWLMGLLSWLVAAGRDTISQVFFVWLVTFSIGLGHLHHSITGSVDVLAAGFSGQGITSVDFGHFLLWTTLGNALGGALFAVLIRYSLVVGATRQRGGGHVRHRG